MIIILQYWPDDRDGIKHAITSLDANITIEVMTGTKREAEPSKQIYIGSHLADAKDAIRANKTALKEKKEKILVVTSTTLGEISGDKITKSLKKRFENSEIFVYSTKPDDLEKKKRIVGSFKKSKHDTEGYQYIATMVKYFMEHNTVIPFLKENPPRKD